MSVSVQLDLVASHPDLNGWDAKVALVLDRLGRKRGEVCHAAETIASRLSCCRRTVELSIKRLIRAGFLAKVRDYELRTRRRLILLWKKPFVSAPACAQSAHAGAPTSSPPYVPPYEELEKDTTNGGWKAGPQAASADSSVVDSGQGEEVVVVDLSRSTQEAEFDAQVDASPRKSTPEEVKAVLDLAEDVFPREPMVREKARHDARKYRLSWVSDALYWAVEHKARDWGYVRYKLLQWLDQGFGDGPPMARKAAMQAVARPAPKPIAPPPLSPEEEAEELTGLKSLAEGPAHDPMARLARAELVKRANRVASKEASLA